MLEETALKITPDYVLSLSASGEILGRYVRHVPPLDLWHRHGLPGKLYATAKRYGEIWRVATGDQSPPYSDPTRIVVDGASAAPEPGLGHIDALRELEVLQRNVIRDDEQAAFLNRLCGAEDWPQGDKRRFKRICKKGLNSLHYYWSSRRGNAR